jgi:hypothetical protein
MQNGHALGNSRRPARVHDAGEVFGLRWYMSGRIVLAQLLQFAIREETNMWKAVTEVLGLEISRGCVVHNDKLETGYVR